MRNSTRHTFAGRTAAIAVAAAALSLFAAPSFGQTWTYDPDVGPGDQFPNSAGQPFETGFQSGANVHRSIVDTGAPDNKVLQIDTQTVPPADAGIFFEIDAPNVNWNVSDATGYSTALRARMDAVSPTEPAALTMLTGNATNFAVLRVYDNTSFPNVVRIAIQDSTGNGGQVIRDLPENNAFHDYRLDVHNGVASVYFDDYPFAVLTKNLAAGAANSIWFGDGTGLNDGKYQIDTVTSWQNGPVGMVGAPNVRDTAHTLFLAHYDGNTGNGGLDADFAAGSATVVGNGALLSAPAKFGAAGVDQQIVPGAALSYNTAGNYDVNQGTIEMWLKPTDAFAWQDFLFQGIFSISDGGNTAPGDVRIQKTSGNALQAFMGSSAQGEGWSITTGDLSTTFGDGEYHHVAWTWDLDVNATALYVDGVVVADRSNVSQINAATSLLGFTGVLDGTFEIGTIQGANNEFDGIIDEFRISGIDLYGGLPFTAELTPWDNPGLTLLLGDADNSGTVTADDLIAVQQNFGNVGPNGDGTDLGDANDDGTVTADDLISVQQNFGNTLGPAASAVPEPGTLCMAMIAALGIFRRARG